MLAKLATVSIAVAVVISISACPSKDGAAGAADAFMGAYYVAINLPAARELTVGLAREKLDRELELTADSEIDVDTRKPRINFKLDEAKEDGDRAQFVFVLDIRPSGAEPFKRTSMLTLKRHDGAWKVSNFNDSDRNP